MTETGCEVEAWRYVACAMPVCATCAPFGAFLSSHFHRQVQAFMIYFLDTVALVSSADKMNDSDTNEIPYISESKTPTFLEKKSVTVYSDYIVIIHFYNPKI